MKNTTLNFSDFNFETVNTSVIVEALNHIRDFLQDQEFEGYFCDLANESLGCDPYIIYHAAAKEWLKGHSLDVFDVIEDVRDYYNQNFGEFSIEINPENIVTCYMDVVLGDVVGCWLNTQLEEDHDLDLWNEEIGDHRELIIKVLEIEIAAWEA